MKGTKHKANSSSKSGGMSKLLSSIALPQDRVNCLVQ